MNWVIVNESSESCLYSVEPSSPAKTAEDIAHDVKEKINEMSVIRDHGTTLYHFVSDSGGPYFKARKLLDEVRFNMGNI